MRSLYVLYDEHCELCKRLKDWLLGQRSWIALGLIPAGSARARAKFPGLEQIAGTTDLVVVSDAGEVYLNNHAWIMCLYARSGWHRPCCCRLRAGPSRRSRRTGVRSRDGWAPASRSWHGS